MFVTHIALTPHIPVGNKPLLTHYSPPTPLPGKALLSFVLELDKSDTISYIYDIH